MQAISAELNWVLMDICYKYSHLICHWAPLHVIVSPAWWWKYPQPAKYENIWPDPGQSGGGSGSWLGWKINDESSEYHTMEYHHYIWLGVMNFYRKFTMYSKLAIKLTWGHFQGWYIKQYHFSSYFLKYFPLSDNSRSPACLSTRISSYFEFDINFLYNLKSSKRCENSFESLLLHVRGDIWWEKEQILNIKVGGRDERQSLTTPVLIIRCFNVSQLSRPASRRVWSPRTGIGALRIIKLLFLINT